MNASSETEQQYPRVESFHWRPWREIAASSLLLMDLSWLIAWNSSLIQPGEWGVKASLFLLYGTTVAVIYLCSKFMLWFQFKTNVRRAVLAFLFLCSYVFMLGRLLYPGQMLSAALIYENLKAAFRDTSTLLPPEFLVLILCAFLVYRSAGLAPSWIGLTVVRRRFRLGTTLLLLLGGLSVFMPRIVITPEILVFLCSSFVALGATRVSSLSVLRGSARWEFSLYSILGVALSAVMVSGAAYLFGDLATKSLASTVAVLFLFVLRLLFILVALLLSPIVFLVAVVVSWLGGNLVDMPVFKAIEFQIIYAFEAIASFLHTVALFIQEMSLHLPDLRWVQPYLLWGLAGLLILIILRELGRREFSLKEVRESILEERTSIDEGSVRLWLKDFLRERAKGISGRLILLDRHGLFGAFRIRRIYAQLMRLCEQLEVPRASTETPLEYLDELELLFPDKRREVRAITQAYNQVRYGEYPETPEEVHVVEQAWQLVRQRGKELRMIKKRSASAG
jgi:hypothetical protein